LINKFLKKRNLLLKTKNMIKWPIKNKLSFLGWTFHLFFPNKKNWITNYIKRSFISYKRQKKLCIYPSKKSTQNLKKKIKNFFSLKNTFFTPQQMIKQLNPMILKWSEYFSPNWNQNLLRSNIDYYIFKCYKQWIFKKYSKKSFKTNFNELIMKNSNVNDTLKTNTTQRLSLKANSIFQLRSLKSHKINTFLGKIKLNTNLTKTIFFFNPKIYILKRIHLFSAKNNYRSKLLIKQKFKCLYCRNELLEWDEIKSWLKENTNKYSIIKDDRKTQKEKINNFSLKSKYEKNFKISKYHIDSILPETLIDKLLVNVNLNTKILIHNGCRKIKKFIDEKLLFSNNLMIKRQLKKNIKFNITNNTFLDYLTLKLILNNRYKMQIYLNYVFKIYGKKYFKLTQQLLEIIKKICNLKLKSLSCNKV
jgi:hypothetical protein